MPSPKAFSGLRNREPWDWPAFGRTFHWQPVPQWLVFSALSYPFSRAFPAMSRAACTDPARAMLSQTAMVVYTMFVPALAVLAVYLLAGRRKLVSSQHRLLAAATLALIVVVSGAEAIAIAAQVRSQWGTLGPAFASLRAACWPPRP